jgi:translation initiation factor IF-2
MHGGEPLRTLVVAPPDFNLGAFSHSIKTPLALNLYSEKMASEQSDLLILIIEADRGLSQDEILSFNRLRELQIPSLILVTSLISPTGSKDDQDRWDFDDVVMLINRTLEKAIAPYLVLHDDYGLPIGLYDLLESSVIDYTDGTPRRLTPEPEIEELVKDFREELEEENFLSSDFTSGLRVVVIPYIAERKIGIAEVDYFLTKLQQVQL